MPYRTLNRTSFVPLYFQLAEKLRLLVEETLSANDQLPSENELVERYRVSRNTVRQAIDLLTKQGLVYRMQGKGTFVAPERMRYSLHKLVSFTEDMHRRGLQPSTNMLEMKEEVPPEDVANNLGLQPGETVYCFKRLRLANGEPMALGTTYIPTFLAQGISSEQIPSGSIFKLIETTTGHRIVYGDRTLKAVVADEAQAELLKIPAGSPLMRVEGVTFLENGLPGEYIIIFYRGDRYDFAYRAVREPDSTFSTKIVHPNKEKS